jgi:hypothetical protein
MFGVRSRIPAPFAHTRNRKLTRFDFSVALHVWIWSRDDLPGLGIELGWIDDYSILFGSV